MLARMMKLRMGMAIALRQEVMTRKEGDISAGYKAGLVLRSICKYTGNPGKYRYFPGNPGKYCREYNQHSGKTLKILPKAECLNACVLQTLSEC